MDPIGFEARLRAEGYPDIRTNEMPPSRHNAEHVHPFDVLALVLEGDITLTIDGAARTYRAGDEFSMETGCYLVGRRAVS